MSVPGGTTPTKEEHAGHDALEEREVFRAEDLVDVLQRCSAPATRRSVGSTFSVSAGSSRSPDSAW